MPIGTTVRVAWVNRAGTLLMNQGVYCGTDGIFSFFQFGAVLWQIPVTAVTSARAV